MTFRATKAFQLPEIEGSYITQNSFSNVYRVLKR